jgi:IS30 family transposase
LILAKGALKDRSECTNLTLGFEYRAAVTVEYKWKAGPATGPEENPQTRLGGSAGSPLVENRAAEVQAMSMSTRRALNLTERIELQAGLRAGESQALIARRLGRSAGAISGELRRNGGREGYQAEVADRQARARRSAARHGRCHIEEHPPLRAEVHARLRRGWSLEEVAGSLWRDNPELPAMHTSHESTYRYVYVVARGELKGELVACLRRHHAARRPRRRSVASAQGQLKDMVLVERTTRYTFLCHLPQKDATSVREAFERKLAPLPGILRQSLTYDQGKEMAEHQSLAANLQLKVFFCHAHSPWERATCESQNDRIRHYLPKGTDLSLVSYQQLRAYQEMLNERPRKILNWKSPAQCFHELLISNQRSN